MSDMGKVLAQQPVGAKLAFQVDRGEGNRSFDVTLGTRPPEAQRRFKNFGPVQQQPSANDQPTLAPNRTGGAPGVLPPGGFNPAEHRQPARPAVSCPTAPSPAAAPAAPDHGWACARCR